MRIAYWKTPAPKGSKLAELRAEYDREMEVEEQRRKIKNRTSDPDEDTRWGVAMGSLLSRIADEEMRAFGRHDSVDFEGDLLRDPKFDHRS